MAKLGRPPKSRTGIDPIAPTLWDRIRRNVNQGLLAPIHASEIARLSQHGEITSTEAAAAFRIGEIYGRYERCIGLTRSARSPSYEMGYSGHPPENQKAADEEHEKAERDATHAWSSLQDRLTKTMLLRKSDLRRLEELCVQNEAISPPDVQEVRKILQSLAQYFRVVSSGKNPGLKQRARAFVRSPSIVPSDAPTPAARPQGVDRASFETAVTMALPNLSKDQVDSIYESYAEKRSTEIAKRDRAKFREEKERPPLSKKKP